MLHVRGVDAKLMTLQMSEYLSACRCEWMQWLR